MNFTKTLSNLSSFQQLCAVVLLIIVGVGAGYTASNASVATHANVPLDQQFKDFDIFAYKSNEVADLMRVIVANPSKYNTMSAHNDLIIVYRSWAEENSGKNKQLFLDYLNACLYFVDNSSPGHISDTTKMNQLYTELNT
jgi:hypothetical protein